MAVIDIAGFVADLKDHAVEHGFHVQMLIGRNDDSVHFGAVEQLAEIRGHEIRANLVTHEFAALGIDLREPDPFGSPVEVPLLKLTQQCVARVLRSMC